LNVGETLYFFRKSRGLKQKEILDYSNSSVYSKIESNKQELRFSELMDFLQKTDITPEEFFEYADTAQNSFRKLFKDAAEQKNNSTLKKRLLSYCFDFKEFYGKSLQELSNCIAIRVFFSSQWSEIDPLSEQELTFIYELIYNNSSHFQYDYILLSNTIFLFNEKQIDSIMKKKFPIKKEQVCTKATKAFITNIMNNVITTYLQKGFYDKACEYLKMAKNQKILLEDISYKIVISYLNNLTDYLITGNYLSIKSVYDCINFLNSIGEENLATNIRTDVENLTSKKEKLPNQNVIHLFLKEY